MSGQVRRLARNITAQVSPDGGSSWLSLPGRNDNNPAFTPTKVDATDVDTSGFTNTEITLQAGVYTAKWNSLSSGGVMAPAHELVEATQGQFGDAIRLPFRFFDNDGGSRGWSGIAVVELTQSKTAVADLREMTATFTWDGAPTKMTQSQINAAVAALSASVPVIAAATPSGQGAAAALVIVGQGFAGVTGASHVTIGGVNAASYFVENDSRIVAVMPAGSAGSAPIIVTNVTGASNPFPYTRT